MRLLTIIAVDIVYKMKSRLPSFSLFVRVRKCFTMLPNLFVTILSGTADNEDLDLEQCNYSIFQSHKFQTLNMIACASKQLKLADYAVDANVTLDVETIWDAWELFSIQSASAVVLVVSPSLSMSNKKYLIDAFPLKLVCPCESAYWQNVKRVCHIHDLLHELFRNGSLRDLPNWVYVNLRQNYKINIGILINILWI
ncbi:hypothetical protein RHGRI_007934 [Rhododendron griersonianum]|uniref:Uncharacterized protein n=1 Tax=Rhododendron griersonianum TaxID=479676 RepID=A0AAV6KYX7_9ERIC|nr:hypothetical protein RHGRI_007934 [Rhododendron griersonianum]